MSEFREFEKQVLHLLVGNELDRELLSELCTDDLPTKYEYTGVGYFITVSHPRLPSEPKTLYRPTVRGTFPGLQCGFIAFLGKHELTLECHGYGDDVPESVRGATPTLEVIADAEV